MIKLFTKIFYFASPFAVGSVVAAQAQAITEATTQVAPVSSPMAYVQTIGVIFVSVLVTGLVNNWLNRASGKKIKEETNGLILKNTKLLLDMKETELQTYRTKIDERSGEINELKVVIRNLTDDNERLIMLLGRQAVEHEKSSE